MTDDGGWPEPEGLRGTPRAATPDPTSPTGMRPAKPRPAGLWRRKTALLATGALAPVVAILMLTASGGGTAPSAAAGPQPANQEIMTGQDTTVVAPRQVSAAELAALPAATTYGTAPNAPLDPAPDAAPDGRVVHPILTVPVFAAPGGPPVAAIPPQQPATAAGGAGSDTWLPVLAEQPGWALVALPTRPNGSTGWLPLDPATVHLAQTPYRITVDRNAFQLTVTRHTDTTDNEDTQSPDADSRRVTVGTWKVGVGEPAAPTPAGRTFILAASQELTPTFSAVILPLGAHSEIHQTYSGGPGTIGLHTWQTSTVYGQATSAGCVRVPPDLLHLLATEVPLGTPVLIK